MFVVTGVRLSAIFHAETKNGSFQSKITGLSQRKRMRHFSMLNKGQLISEHDRKLALLTKIFLKNPFLAVSEKSEKHFHEANWQTLRFEGAKNLPKGLNRPSLIYPDLL